MTDAPSSQDDAGVSGVEAHPTHLGGFTARSRPTFGLRPTLRFSLAVSLTIAYLVFAVWVSRPWRSDLEAEIEPVVAWGIPILL
jgi:hypothetical protein